jgi:glucokinase
MTSARPRAVTCHPASQAIGLDIGGTKIAGGVVTADGSVVERFPDVPTPPEDGTATLTILRQIIDELRTRHPRIEAIGVGAAGLIEWPDGRIRWAPNNAYRALPLRRLLRDATGLPVVVDNDANTAAWAEARLGKNASHMAFLTVGTGLGGGLILDGRLYRGTTGIGAEVGHMVVDPHSTYQCGCGNVGCLESVASGSALGRYGREAAAASPESRLASLADGALNVTGEIVFLAARDGDPTARELFARAGHWLGIGIASLVTLLEFELIVIGGGVATAGELLLDPARASFRQFLFAREHRELPPIIPARLGPEAGWIGSALLALDHEHGSSSLARSRPAPAASCP